MNKKLFILLLFMFNNYFIFSQNIDTLILVKNKKCLYKGKNDKIQNWYLYTEMDKIYLSELQLELNEIPFWFEKRKDSQNIFKYYGNLKLGNTITLKKDNEINTEIILKIININDNEIEFFNEKINENFLFEKKYSIDD